MRSAGLFEWTCRNQADVNCEFAHGWWNSAEFFQLLSSDFEDFDFDVITSFSMDTPPPSSIITMPVVSARRTNLEIVFKESWVLEPNYTVTVKWEFPRPIILLDILQPMITRINGCYGIFPASISTNHIVKGLLLFLGQLKISTFCTVCFTSSAFRPRPVVNPNQ